MKILKRLRGFFQRRIPFLRRKRKDKSAKTSKGSEDVNENKISNQVCEVNGEMNRPMDQLSEEFRNDKELRPDRYGFKETNNEIFNGVIQFPLQKATNLGGQKEERNLPENLKGVSKNDEGMTSNRDEVKENEEISEEDVQFPAEKIMISDEQSPPERLEGNLKNDKKMTPKTDAVKEVNKEMSDEGDQFSTKKTVSLDDSLPPDRLKKNRKMDKRMTPSKDDFIDGKKEISRKAVPCPLEKYMLWEGPLVQGWEEIFQVGKGETVEKLSSSDGEDEKSTENRPLLESSEESEGPWNPENNTEFDVDFETAFGKNAKESDAGYPWYHTSSTKIENLGLRSKEPSYHQLVLENDKQIDEKFEAVFGFDANEYEENNSYNEAFKIFQDNTQKKQYCNEPVDPNYDFEDDYAEFSDEEKAIEKVQKKKLMAVFGNRPSKKLVFENYFRYSDIDNKMYLTEIKDPLKRKDTVRSDLTGFKYLPFCDSNNMKKYYSEGDLSRPPPDFAIAFTNRKE